MADDLERVDALIDDLLATHDPKTTKIEEFRGAQYDRGLAWVHFPEGFGGLGLSPTLQRHVDSRLRAAGARAPHGTLFFGLSLAGPTVVTHGSDELRQRALRPMFTGEEIWCQLFSEPGAGSDLAGLATRAVKDGDEWVVNGQKVWNTLAHVADRGMLVARTDPDLPEAQGPHVLHGRHARARRRGAAAAPDHRRSRVQRGVPHRRAHPRRRSHRRHRRRLARVDDDADERAHDDRRRIERRAARRATPIAEAIDLWSKRGRQGPGAPRPRSCSLWIDFEVLRLNNARAAEKRRIGNPGPEGSIAKLQLANLNKAAYEFCIDLLGADGIVDYDYTFKRPDEAGLDAPLGSARKMFLRARANSIEGGTSEIMRNILGERILGLPGEPRVDRDIPWSQVPRN